MVIHDHDTSGNIRPPFGAWISDLLKRLFWWLVPGRCCPAH